MYMYGQNVVAFATGILEWVVEQCVQPDLTMVAARMPDQDHQRYE